jgi:hypothetical protein
MGSTGRAKKLEDSNPRCTCGDWGAVADGEFMNSSKLGSWLEPVS